MSIKRCVALGLLGMALVVSGCKVDKVEEKHHPAKLEETSEKGIMKVTLEPQAVANGDLEPLFREKPAIHRFPGSMAGRVRELAADPRAWV